MEKTGLRIGRHYGPGGKESLFTLKQALEEGASAMQLFGGNPRHYWCSKSVSDEHARLFREYGSHLYKVVHACYITNIAEDPDGENGRAHRMTIHSLVNHLEWAERMGCDSVVFHPGSPKDKPRDDAMNWSFQALKEVLTTYQGPVELLLENAAHKKKIGGPIDDLVELCAQIDDERLGICIDTTHAYAAGFDLKPMVAKMHDLGNLLRLVHFNQPDAEVELGKQMDRHSSAFVAGRFSIEQIAYLYGALREHGVPLILEGTPSLPEDLAWILRWELESRAGNTPSFPEPSLGEIFDL